MRLDLKYFDFTGRGEVLRILLHGTTNSVRTLPTMVEWTDTRIPFSDWKTIQPNTPLGHVPLLSVDGTDMTQSTSLYRYCAKLVNLYPSSDDDPFQALLVDETMDTLNDMLGKMPKMAPGRIDNDTELQRQRHIYRDTILKRYLDLIDSRIAQYGASTHTICGIPSVADLHLLTMKTNFETNTYSHLDGSMFENYPHILDVTHAMSQHPIVISYRNK